MNFYGYKGKNVYVFELSNGEVKIGASKNVKNRIKQIERQNRCKVTNYDCSCILANWRKVEMKLHEHFKDYLVSGQAEYFKIDFYEAVDKLIEIENEMGVLKERNPIEEDRAAIIVGGYFGWI